MAPELIDLKKFDLEKVDQFAAAVILHMMVTGTAPFADASHQDS